MKAHLPRPSPAAQASSSKLFEIITQEIKAQNNWIPFSRFMELALYTSEYGYYTGGSHKIGTDGDFITAPTLTPLFGQTFARQLAELLPQTAGNIYEFGAGTTSSNFPPSLPSANANSSPNTPPRNWHKKSFT